MAGSFGFEAEQYDISVKIGERVLLPEVRGAPTPTRWSSPTASVAASRSPTLPVASALHLAQVIQMAMREGPDGPAGELPESSYEPLGKWEPAPSLAATAVVGGAGILLGLGLAYVLTQRRRPLT